MNLAARARRPLLSALVALAVLVATVAVPASAEAATTHVTLTGASSGYKDKATTFTVTWKVGSTGHRGTVTLQRRSGSTWKKVASAKTSTKGVAKLTVKPSATTTYRVRTSTGKTSASKKLTVHASYALTSTAGSTIMAGTSKKFSVTYKHDGAAVKAATVALERKSGSAWVRVSNVKVTKGKGSVTVKPTVTTTYRFRKPSVVTSATHKVTVKPPSSFAVTGSGDGHGVGMSQYGAYDLALAGASATTILSKYYPGTHLEPSTNPARRIGVQVFGPGSDTATTTTISVAAVTSTQKPAWQVVDASSTAKVLRTGTGAVTMTVGVSGGRPTVKVGTTTYTATRLDVQWSGTSVSGAPASTVAAVASVKGAHGTYRNGQLVVTAIAGKAQPNVVNDVLLNTEYLYGVDEMPSSWGTAGSGKGLQALEAQAIASRGYALLPALKAPTAACGCTVYDDTRSQNYTGWTKQHGAGGSTWVAAVNATVHPATAANATQTADALTYGGPTSFVETPFYAATGSAARTAANHDVFGSAALPYLKGVADPYTAKAPGLPAADKTWTDSVSQATAKKIFGLSTVRAIAVTTRYGSGQVKTLTATSDTGSTKKLTKTAEAWRTALGLKASWVTRLTPTK